MTALMILITLMNSAGGKASDLFGELTGIAVLLTMLPYFYSCVDLIRFEGVNIRNFVSLICSVLGCVFCFIALMGASSFELAGTFIVSLIILMFYARKMHERQSHSMDNPPRLTHIIKSIFRGSSFHFVPCVGRGLFTWRYDYERYCNIESHGGLF